MDLTGCVEVHGECCAACNIMDGTEGFGLSFNCLKCLVMLCCFISVKHFVLLVV